MAQQDAEMLSQLRERLIYNDGEISFYKTGYFILQDINFNLQLFLFPFPYPLSECDFYQDAFIWKEKISRSSFYYS